MAETKLILLENGRVIDPVQGWDGIRTIAAENGRFVSLDSLSAEDLRQAKHLDCTGKVVCPGFIDMHVHLREPGQTHKGDIASESAAALAGGFTTIVAMPNTTPAVDSLEMLDQIRSLCAAKAKVRVLQSVCLSQGRGGKQLSPIEQVAQREGSWIFSDDGSTPQSDELFEAALMAAAKSDSLVIDHCEDRSLSVPGVMHAGAVADKMGLPGQPRLAEERIVQRDLELAGKTGCRIHLQHLSSAGSVELLRQARLRGVRATGEVTPHHLCLTDEACLTWGTNAKMAPPLREETDRHALIQGIRDGVLTVVASDHAPHTLEEKAKDWSAAPFGITSMEVEVPLVFTELLAAGISLPQIVSLFTKGPRELLQMPLGALIPGECAECTILSPCEDWTIHVADFVSRGKNSPYEGRRVNWRANAWRFPAETIK